MFVRSFLVDIARVKIGEDALKTAKQLLLEAPKHGELLLDEQSGSYFSKNYSYSGPDRAVVLVEIGGHKVTLRYFFELMADVPGSSDQGTARDDRRICPKGAIWMISLSTPQSRLPVPASPLRTG